MRESKLTCLMTKSNAHMDILSPSIGQLEILVEQGQVISEGHKVARLKRLGSSFSLVAPEGCHGQIILQNHPGKFINVGYKEFFVKVAVELASDFNLGKDRIHPSHAVQNKKHESIVAPMDGMFYLSASPNDPPFVTVGQEIKPGQTLGLIEVMKCFYPLQYGGQKNAMIASISIKNATPVTSGVEIFLLE